MCTESDQGRKLKPREHSILVCIRSALKYIHADVVPEICGRRHCMARDFERSLGDSEIEKDKETTPVDILDDVKIEVLSMTKDFGNSWTRTTTQKTQGRHYS